MSASFEQFSLKPEPAHTTPNLPIGVWHGGKRAPSRGERHPYGRLKEWLHGERVIKGPREMNLLVGLTGVFGVMAHSGLRQICLNQTCHIYFGGHRWAVREIRVWVSKRTVAK